MVKMLWEKLFGKSVNLLAFIAGHSFIKPQGTYRVPPKIHKNQVRIRVLGKLDTLPEEISESAHYVMEQTKKYDKYSFNIALAYGGREEIIQAIQKIAIDVKEDKISIDEIKEPIVSKYLYTNGIPDPDIILRTSGEERISNFLLWQLAYSELYFSDVYWPAFQKRDFF